MATGRFHSWRASRCPPNGSARFPGNPCCLADHELKRRIAADTPLCTAHSLQDQIGGQLDSGFVLTGLREFGHTLKVPSSEYFDGFIITRAMKPA